MPYSANFSRFPARKASPYLAKQKSLAESARLSHDQVVLNIIGRFLEPRFRNWLESAGNGIELG
jgi:hypothetical protein